MEKIYDFSDADIYRFHCDCYEPSHSIDVEIQKNGAGEIIFTFYDHGGSLGQKLKWCWLMITKGRGYNHDWVIRGEDVTNLIDILKSSIHPKKEE